MPDRLNDAAAAFREALRLLPDFAEAHNNLGLVLAEQGKLDEAVAHYREALRIQPGYALAHHNLGKALLRQGNAREAEEHFREAVRLQPGHAQAHLHLGDLLRAAGRRDEAIDAYRASVKADPRDHRPHNELGVCLLDAGRPTEAVDCFRAAARLKPDFVPAYNNLGVALLEIGKLDDARVRLGQALALNPRFAESHYNLGRVLAESGLPDEALEHFREAVRLKPEASGAWNNLANACKDQGLSDEAVACYRRAVAAAPADASLHSNLLYGLLYHPGVGPDEAFREHQEFGRRHSPSGGPPAPPPAAPLAGRRLRVGYVSGDFRAHVLGLYSEMVVGAHDRSRFEVFCYSNVRRADVLTERIKKRADHWRPLAGLTDAQAAELVRRDGIDVLIDLAGHTAANRLPLFALRAAPVQATHYGYPATSGLAVMDYRITDADVDPPGRTEKWHTEKLIRLPHCWWCYRGGAQLDPGPPPCVAAGYVTFGSFNNLAKVSGPALAAWARLLRALPGSRLHVLAGTGVAGEKRVREALARGGVEEGRVSLPGRRSTDDYFKLFQSVDVCLDPFPYTGCNSTADALWMGVPVVTLAGPAAVGRHGVSTLRLVGLGDLITETPDAYVEAAVRVASDLSRLKELRAGLRDRLRHSPVMDVVGFTRALEAAYLAMWEERVGRSSAGERAVQAQDLA